MLIMWKYRFLALGLTLILGGPCLAMDDAKLTKTVSRSFKVLPETELEINNKYGDVIINDWDQDSVSIVITITAFGKDDEAAKRLIDRTATNFNTSALRYSDLHGIEQIGWMDQRFLE